MYSGAVDGLSSADLSAVVEEVEHEAEVLKKAFQRAFHRALESVALLGELAAQCTKFISNVSPASYSCLHSASLIDYRCYFMLATYVGMNHRLLSCLECSCVCSS